MKIALKYFLFGFITMSLLLVSCKDEKEEPKKPLAIGDFYEGGVIFYLDATLQHGLACAVNDQSSNTEWCDMLTEINGADGEAIGTGTQNTLDILAGCGVSGSAAELCANLTLNGKSDWFLPSKDEFSLIYTNRAIIDATAIANGGTAFGDVTYWTSTEVNSGNFTNAVTQSFEFGISGTLTKFGTAYVRAVRAF